MAPVIEPFTGTAPVQKEVEQGPPLVELVWHDILKEPGWEPAENVELPVFRSVGWLMFEDDTVVKIADTLDEEGVGFGIMALPRGVVLARKYLKQ